LSTTSSLPCTKLIMILGMPRIITLPPPSPSAIFLIRIMQLKCLVTRIITRMAMMHLHLDSIHQIHLDINIKHLHS
jgi:hypothetical protein